MDKMDMDYYQHFEELMDAIANLDGLNLLGINTALGKLCVDLNISKGVTCFYDSEKHESLGKGDEFVCYDSGEECHVAKRIRIVTPAMTVVTCETYQANGAEPLTPVQEERVELIMRCIVTYLSSSRLQRIVERLTFYDYSDYPNMRYFVRELNRKNAAGKLDGMVAINFNLKHFSAINQDLGRATGDMIMRNYIAHLQEIIEDGCICRLGGDGFLMLFDSKYLNKVIDAFDNTQVVADINETKHISVSAWAGVYVIDMNECKETTNINDRVILALQTAKSQGKKNVVFYSESLAHDKEKVRHVQQLFPEAIEKEEFLVYYQPKIDIVTGKLSGAEALCRWRHDGQIINPVDFIPILEMGNEICKVDFYMLDHVCRDIRRWLDEGKKPVRISVNFSRKHMIDMDLVESILDVIDRNNVPHQYIEIELTETTTDVEFRDLKRVVSGLQQAGVWTSVDDFGIGYSSLNLIREVPWNVLKVDKSFIPLDDEKEDSITSIMLKYVVAMAKELGLECIAEGVETHKQVETLRDNKCDLAQGFYFDKPLPKDEFEDRLKEGKYEVA